MASSPTPPRNSQEDAPAAAVCCMCGDHGLVRELFRCRSCRVRLQHSYCSDLYPRATAYRRCNWCLVGEPLPPPPAQQSAAAGTTTTKRKVASSDEEARQQQQRQRRHEGSRSSSSSAPELVGYPAVKKKKRDNNKACEERTAPPADAGVMKTAGSCSLVDLPSGDSNKELLRAGKARVRVKVRRYKLLAEVISC